MRVLLFTIACSISLSSNAVEHGDPEVLCLAENIYHEARGQDIDGRLAVAHVSINRMESKRFPDTLCGVIKQGYTKPSWKDGRPIPIKNKCQFSWYCDGRVDEILEPDAWDSAWRVAYFVYSHRVEKSITDSRWNDSVEGAMWYHNTQVDPYWVASMQKVKQEGSHIFYIAGN